MTVKDVIVEVCREANVDIEGSCYLRFDSRDLNDDHPVSQTGLDQTSSSTTDLPEVRLKCIRALEIASHLGKQVFLASPEHIAPEQILQITLPSTKDQRAPPALKIIAEQMAQRTSFYAHSPKTNGTVLIPLPNFSKQSIDSLPTIHLRLPLSPNQFDWNVILECLANDLEIDRTDLIIVNAQEGSTKLNIKLRSRVAQAPELLKKVGEKLRVMFLPKCEEFIEKHRQWNVSKVEKMQIELENFAERKTSEDSTSLSEDEIDLALRLSERPAIFPENIWDYTIEKSRQIGVSVMQSIQLCSDEYVIDHASLVFNEQIYKTYGKRTHVDQTEKVLFHGTSATNIHGIFENNFQYDCGVKRTDDGWYGQGIYFSSSAKKALNYAKSNSKISYLICSLVRLGKTLTVRDMRFKGKPMHPDYDSHYVPIRIDGDPAVEGEQPAYEEFVIKHSEQIMPLYVVGLLKVSRFVLWRDAKIANEANASIFEAMTQKYAFNIYGAETSKEARKLLRCKLSNESMKCVVVTNGADNGQRFVRKCRFLKSSLPIIVYCKNKEYHQQWAAQLQGPTIHVTTSPEEVFQLINDLLR